MALSSQGVSYIFDHFETFFSIIEHVKTVQKQILFRSTDLLFESIDALGKILAEFLERPDVSVDERNSNLNALKMLIYTQISLVKTVDKDVMVQNDGKNKTKKQSAEDVEQTKWDDKRYIALLQIFNVLELPLSNLWQPPVAEESFVNLCADLAYRTLEHPTIKNKKVEDTTFQILGTLLKNYNHAFVFPVRILQVLKSCETALPAIANGLVLLHDQYKIKSILKLIIDKVLGELQDTPDPALIKNASHFLAELGTVAPNLMMPYIREIGSDFLDLESYQLRICVLQMMTEVILAELTGEELTQDAKDTRDEFLDSLLLHMNDVNAHVRSKAISLWINLKNENAVPLIWLSYVVKQAVFRLEDKSNLVRKNAINLVKSFLEHNPYAAKLSIEELEKRYNEKKNQLADFRDKMMKEANKMDEVNEKWEAFLNEMMPFIVKCVKQESIEDERIRAEDCSGLYEQFPQMLEDKNYKRLVLLVRKAEELNGNWETIRGFEPEAAHIYFGFLLRSYYLLQNNFKNYEEDYKKTENAVRFLEDSLEFSRIIVSAVPKLKELLMSKSDSDVNEAIDFFTAAFRFGIKNTEGGMRQMLYLIWVASKEKRDPLREAYKCVLLTTDLQGR